MNEILAALVNGAVPSILLTAAVWLAMRIATSRLNAATRYLVWWTVLVVTVLLPLAYLPEGLLPRVAAVHSQPVLTMTNGPGEFVEPQRSVAPVALTTPAAPARIPWFPIRVAAGSVPQGAAAVWAIIAALMLLRLAFSWLVLRRRIARSTEAPGPLSVRLDGWLRQCGSRRRLRIVVSAEIAMPMVAGLRRPSILLPATLLGALGEDELDQIGIHEAAHIARCDDRALILQRILEALLPLHPAVRWIARRIDLEREIACDDFVVRAFGNPRPYAACLTRVAELTGGVRSSIVAAGVADERSHLTTRVDMLLDKSRHSGPRPLKGPLAAGIIVILAVTQVTAHTPGMIAFTAPAARELPTNALVAVAAHGPTSGPVVHKMADPPAVAILPEASDSPRPSDTRESAASISALTSVPLLSQAVNADVMRIPVVVRDPRNRLVTGLDKGTFRLFEDGVEQNVAQLRARPCTALGVLISTSDSTDPKRTQMRAAFQEFARTTDPVGEFSVVETGTVAGSSAAIDTWMSGLATAPDSRRVILVISDGGGDSNDDRAAQFADEQRRIAGFVQQDVLVYAVNLADSNKAPTRFMMESTVQTGGHVVTATADTVASAAAGIGAEVRNLYELEYRPKNTTHGGAYRTVRVELIVPRGLPPLKLEYRSGYYEPPR